MLDGVRIVAAAVACIVISSAAGRARADNDTATAEAAFLKGKDLMKAGKIEEACDAFARSQTLDPQDGTAYNLALCDEQAGKLASAWGLFRQLAQTDSNKKRRKDSDKHGQALAPRLTKMLITVDFEGVPGIVITRNGDDVTAAVGIESPVDPGDYTIVVTAPGYQSFTATVSATGEGMTVAVSVPPLEKTAATQVTEPAPGGDRPVDRVDPAPVATTRGGGGHRKVIGLSVAGGGIVIAATGLVFGALASSHHQEALDVCGGDTRCANADDAAAATDLEARAHTDGNVASVLVAAGGVALAAGIVLWLTAPSGHHASEHAILFTPVVTDDTVAVSIRGWL
jgi:hypothetical protein